MARSRFLTGMTDTGCCRNRLGFVFAAHRMFLCKPGRLAMLHCAIGHGVIVVKSRQNNRYQRSFREGAGHEIGDRDSRRTLLVFCISATSAAFAAGGKAGRSADGLSCSFSVPANAPPAGAAPRSAGNAAEILRQLLRR